MLRGLDRRARWPTCPRARSPRTRPGWPAPPSATTCCAPPGPWPASPAPKPAAPRCAATSSTSPPAPPATAAAHITLHLPEGWHRETEWMNLFEAACGPPAARGLTSPDPVTAPQRPQRPPGNRQPASPARTLDKPQNSERQENHARRPPQDHSAGPAPENDHPNSRGGSRLRVPVRRRARARPTRTRAASRAVRLLYFAAVLAPRVISNYVSDQWS